MHLLNYTRLRKTTQILETLERRTLLKREYNWETRVGKIQFVWEIMKVEIQKCTSEIIILGRLYVTWKAIFSTAAKRQKKNDPMGIKLATDKKLL